MLERNIGRRDRALRLLVSVALLLAGMIVLEPRAALIDVGPVAVGFVALVTAVTGRSPLYAALRISTLGLARVPTRVPLALSLLLATLLAACGSPAGGASTVTATLASGSYVYHPTPFVWQVVSIADGAVIGSTGVVYEWNCAGQRWTIGRIPATLGLTQLQFGDDRFVVAGGALDARWQRTADADPRRGASLVCTDPMPTTKTVLSVDAARELIKRTVTDIAPVLVPTTLPDRSSAMVEANAASFSVTYIAEDGVRAMLRTVPASPAPIEAGGTRQRLAFRGDAGALYQALGAGETTTRSLLWLEPASKPSALGPASCACVPYALTADGLDEAEFWKIAGSLQ